VRDPAQPVVFLNGVNGRDAAAQRLLAGEGYEVVRRFWQMALDLGDDEPAWPRLPADVTVAPVPEAGLPAVHDVLQRSFAEPWGFVPESYEERQRRYDGLPGPRLGAWVGGELVGVLHGSWRRLEMGWIDALGVLDSHRRRGLGAVLLQAVLVEFHRRGERR